MMNFVPLAARVVALNIVAISVAFVLCLSSGSRISSAQVNIEPWTLLWSDEFDGLAGTRVDTDKWIYDLGTGYPCAGCPVRWGTGEVEVMTDSTANVYQDGQGHLVIKPLH